MGTTLLQDQIGGLQVLHQDQWVDVPPMPGAFIINIGDLMQVNSSLLLDSSNQGKDNSLHIGCIVSQSLVKGKSEI